jgi:ELWxxDGT repeat protein
VARRRMARLHLLAVLVALIALTGTSQAQSVSPTATFVKDLGGVPNSSSLGSMTTVGGVAYFSACTLLQGCELWKTDGTTAGTALVKDINPGQANSYPGNLTNVNGTLFFVATDDLRGRELWKSDGTSVGTVRVKDIAPGSADGNPGHLTNVNGTLFFVADDGTTGSELWKSDGTDAGTVLVRDINPGSSSCVCGSFASFKGLLFFAANNGVTGNELWKSDGTEAGTVQVFDAIPGAGAGLPMELLNVDGTLYFSQGDNSSGRELWKSNGTPEGTVRVKDIVPGPVGGDPRGLIANGGSVFFMAWTSATGGEWWKTDGTEAGTTIVKDLTPGPEYTDSMYPVAVAGGLTFFTSYGFELQQRKLWVTDGSDSGTVLIKEGLRDVRTLGTIGQTRFFYAYANGEGALWRSDGTALGTVIVKHGLGGAGVTSASLGGLLLFESTDALNTNGLELWKTDGTDAGTAMVADINPTKRSSISSVTAAANGTTYFVAYGAPWQVALWKTNGTSGGTAKVLDVQVDSGLAALGGSVIFGARDAVDDIELWRSTGSPAGTGLVKDIWPGVVNQLPQQSRPTTPMTLDNLVLFAARDASGPDLWKTDGTAAGTMRVSTAPTSSYSGNLLLRAVAKNAVFFADVRIVGSFSNLWKSDGTLGGTVLISDKYTSGLTVVGDVLYFASRRALYKTDGTPSGTVLVSPLGTNPNAPSPDKLTNVNGTLFFTLDTELWKSDGTESGTVQVRDAGSSTFVANELASNGATLFFTSSHGGSGDELWKTDGTSIGTVLVKDIISGPRGSMPGLLTPVGAYVFFTAVDDVHGRELWASDGTDAGTMMVKDIWPGAGSSDPDYFGRSGNLLFFIAFDPIHGTQLWRATAGASPTTTDTDGDGLPNQWETNFGLNPSVAIGDDGPDGDPDHDGVSNLDEYLAGTHPKVAATLSADKTTLRFGAEGTPTAFSAQTAAQTVRLSQQGTGTLSWSVVTDKPWLQVSPAGGTGPGLLSITVRPDASLEPSGGIASVRFFLVGSDRPFQDITVALALKPAGQATPPIGLVETPTDNRTGVSGSVPFTGWAVDDFDVANVTICRDAVGAEVAPLDPNCGGARKIFVGTGVLIDGARPDVETAAAAYPRSSRAGWGFMVLTNTLPNQGNGTFVFSVYAQDVQGLTTLLGTRTMTCDNAHATLPFGTIDTPLQGGVASGAQFVNFGWALTPTPKSIPVDGSTITVFLDGAAIGQVNYNHNRPDVEAAFPGLANSHGAVGYRTIDTTLLSNGLHTISWTVADDSGAIAGIGSRFFTVANVGDASTTPTEELHAVAAAMSAETAARFDVASVAAAPPDDTPLVARRGWDLDTPWNQYAVGADGRGEIRGEELDRFELLLGTHGDELTGYLRVGDTLTPLPAGSRVDAREGTFTWAPGAGFVGTYDLVFVQSNHGRAVARREVRFILAAKGSAHVAVP